MMHVKVLNLNKFSDKRGFFIETFSKKKFFYNFKLNFVEDDISFSKKNVLRGFHGDFKTWKLITCILGRVQIAYINNNKNQKKYKSNKSIILCSNKPKQVLLPPGYGLAYLTLSKVAILHYKQTEYYRSNKQFEINYKSPCLNFKWKKKKILVSERDMKSKVLS